jgi:hypothetical protein
MIEPRRVRVTADWGFTDSGLSSLRPEPRVALVMRVKKSTKAYMVGVWRQLNVLKRNARGT